MKYCLGEFSLQPQATFVNTELLDLALTARSSRSGQPELGARDFWARLRALIQSAEGARLRELKEIEEAPDLLRSLPDGSSDREWAAEIASAMRTLLGEGASPRLDVCEGEGGPDGYLAIGAHAETLRRAVRQRDLVSAGFVVIRSGFAEPRIYPRVYRKVCANGAVVLEHTETAFVPAPGEFSKAVFSCVGGAFRRAVSRLRRAARTEVPDPVGLLRRSGAPVDWADVEGEFERAGDRSAWGLVNAVTARARSERDFPRRLEIERSAGLIVESAEARLALS